MGTCFITPYERPMFLLPPAMKLGQGNIFKSECQEFCPQGGGGACLGCAWQGVMHGIGHAWQGACMAGGHAWQGGVCGRGMHGGGMHGRGGLCMVGGHVCGGGCACQGGCVWQILQDTVNEWAVHILLECILVFKIYWSTSVEVLWDYWYRSFRLLVMYALGLKTGGGSPCFHALLPAHNGFPRFTSGATPADLQVASMATEPFTSTYLHMYKH